MGMMFDKNKYYSSLTPEFTPICAMKSISSFINKTLKTARKLKYDSRNNECEVVEDGNNV